MKYNCPICRVEMFESNFCNMRSCRECHLSIEVKVLDAIADKDARIAELKKERDGAQECVFDVTEKLYQLALGIKNGTAKQTQVSDAFRLGLAIMERYK